MSYSTQYKNVSAYMEMQETESRTPPELHVSSIDLRDPSYSEPGHEQNIYAQLQAERPGSGRQAQDNTYVEPLRGPCAAILLCVSHLAAAFANFVFIINRQTEMFDLIRDTKSGLLRAFYVLQAIAKFIPVGALLLSTLIFRISVASIIALMLTWVLAAQDAIQCQLRPQRVFPFWSYWVLVGGSILLICISGTLQCQRKRRFQPVGDVQL